MREAEVIGRRELYRRFSRVSETLIEAADRVWYATVKELTGHSGVVEVRSGGGPGGPGPSGP